MADCRDILLRSLYHFQGVCLQKQLVMYELLPSHEAFLERGQTEGFSPVPRILALFLDAFGDTRKARDA